MISCIHSFYDNLEQLWYVLYDFLSYLEGMFFTSIAKIVNWFDRNYPQRYWFSPQLMDLMYPRWVHELSKPGKLRRDLLLRVLQSRVHAGMSGGVDTRNRQVWHFTESEFINKCIYIYNQYMEWGHFLISIFSLPSSLVPGLF